MLAGHGEAVSLAGMAHNLPWVALGNAMDGAGTKAAGSVLAAR